MIQLEKSLYDGGASPEDIAMVISMAAKHGSISPVTPGNYSFNFCHSSAVILGKRPGSPFSVS
jgi:hypothetical protein